MRRNPMIIMRKNFGKKTHHSEVGQHHHKGEFKGGKGLQHHQFTGADKCKIFPRLKKRGGKNFMNTVHGEAKKRGEMQCLVQGKRKEGGEKRRKKDCNQTRSRRMRQLLLHLKNLQKHNGERNLTLAKERRVEKSSWGKSKSKQLQAWFKGGGRLGRYLEKRGEGKQHFNTKKGKDSNRPSRQKRGKF